MLSASCGWYRSIRDTGLSGNSHGTSSGVSGGVKKCFLGQKVGSSEKLERCALLFNQGGCC